MVECGDAVSAHDFAALVGYSASGIYPYMAHDCIRSMAARGDLSASDGRALTADEAVANYNRAAVAGIVSIMSKMGISTAQSYHSAQIFEAVGLSDEVCRPLLHRHGEPCGRADPGRPAARPGRPLQPRARLAPRPAPASCPPSDSPSGARSAARTI